MRLFKRRFWSALPMIYFSVKRRSQGLVPQRYDDAYAAILDFNVEGVSASLNCHTCFESSVSCSYNLFLKDFVWLLYLNLNSPSLAP